MPAIITRRRLRDLEKQRQELADTKTQLAEAEAAYDRDRRQLGQQVAERDQRIAEIETHNTNLRAQLDLFADATPALQLADDDLASETAILAEARRLCGDP